MGEEGLELLAKTVMFEPGAEPDELLERFSDHRMTAEMQKVFFSEEPNSLGHSYAKLICGPGGRHDLQDVVELLRLEPMTKRAVASFSVHPGGKVPCITAVQFLVRQQAVQLVYFARGQDVFNKFYADALCLAIMGKRVAGALQLSLGPVRGLIGSSHIYHRDLPAIRQVLAAARQFLAGKSMEGALM